MNRAGISEEDLHELFELKYGDPKNVGWNLKRRLKWGHFQPGDIYEALVKSLVKDETNWIDVGGGRNLFPKNQRLSEILSKKCQKLVAVDPSGNVFENLYAHEKVQCLFEDFVTDHKFDLATFRMVAEHISNPQAVVEKLNEIISKDGTVVIYTIFKYSPIPILTYLTPFKLHYIIKKIIWGGEEKDTFPVAFKMNTRKILRKVFEDGGFEEKSFHYLDDLSAFGKFKWLNLIEMTIWKFLNTLGLHYPEVNILAIYSKPT